jgi:hypothetical protein
MLNWAAHHPHLEWWMGNTYWRHTGRAAARNKDQPARLVVTLQPENKSSRCPLISRLSFAPPAATSEPTLACCGW